MTDELQLSEDLVLRKYAEWRVTASRAYITMGIRLSLSNDVWEALAHHAHLERRMLCEDVVSLPRELRDIIYDALLEDMAPDLTLGDCSHRESSWRHSLPHLKASLSGQVFLHEFMGLFYSQTAFKFAYKVPGRTAPGDASARPRSTYDSQTGQRRPTAEKQHSIPPLDKCLWHLLTNDPFGSTHAPATLIEKIEIILPRNYHNWEDPSPADYLEVPKDATPITNSKVKVTISSESYRYCLGAKSCCRRRMPRPPPVYPKELLRRMEPALTRLTELGVDVQLNDVYYRTPEELYPSSKILDQLREEAAAMHLECRESSRPGLRKLGGVRKRYA